MSTFNPNTPFERSRKRLAVVLLIQLLVTVLLAGSSDEKIAVGLVGGVSLVAVLTKRPWYTSDLKGRVLIGLLLFGLGGAAIFCGVGAFLTEASDGAISGEFWIWLAPLAAAVVAILDFISSILAVSPRLTSAQLNP